MAAETSWTSYSFDYTNGYINGADSFSELSDDDENEDYSISMDLLLPDDLLERILSCLPIASIFRASCVCKRWHEIITSQSFLRNFPYVASQKPWYFMFTGSDEPTGYAYDPTIRKWYGIDLPCIEASSWFIASSSGLVCFMDNDRRNRIFVCNPFTKIWRKLIEPPGPRSSDYSALSFSVSQSCQSYSVVITKSKQALANFFQWDLSIHVYNSETMMWSTSITDVLTGWRAGDESIICSGVLYILIYATGGGAPENRHGVIAYNLLSRSSGGGTLMRSFISVPCQLTCGRLMNLKERLVLVGGIGKQDRPDIIKGIGIWVLRGNKWDEITRMPHKYFQGFGEFDDVFASRGTDELIYIQSYGAPALLTFDMNQRLWKWCQKCPVTKRFPLQLFTGFCFEPRLQISP